MYRNAYSGLLPTLFGWTASLHVLSLLQGSWKEQLRAKFINFRTPALAKKRERECEGEEFEVTTQAPKRGRGRRHRVMSDEDRKQYEEEARRLKDECGELKMKKKQVKYLMQATYNGRRVWVEDDLPQVFDVLEKFPLLKKPKHVSHSFKLFVHLHT